MSQSFIIILFSLDFLCYSLLDCFKNSFDGFQVYKNVQSPDVTRFSSASQRISQNILTVDLRRQSLAEQCETTQLDHGDGVKGHDRNDFAQNQRIISVNEEANDNVIDIHDSNAFKQAAGVDVWTGQLSKGERDLDNRKSRNTDPLNRIYDADIHNVNSSHDDKDNHLKSTHCNVELSSSDSVKTDDVYKYVIIKKLSVSSRTCYSSTENDFNLLENRASQKNTKCRGTNMSLINSTEENKDDSCS